MFFAWLTLKTKINWYTATDIFFKSYISKFSFLSIILFAQILIVGDFSFSQIHLMLPLVSWFPVSSRSSLVATGLSFPEASCFPRFSFSWLTFVWLLWSSMSKTLLFNAFFRTDIGSSELGNVFQNSTSLWLCCLTFFRYLSMISLVELSSSYLVWFGLGIRTISSDLFSFSSSIRSSGRISRLCPWKWYSSIFLWQRTM